MSASAITALIESSRYNPEILGELENHLQHQIDSKTYHFEANLAILKLYQFHPKKSNTTVIKKILIKALMNTPSTDFLLSSYLIPEKIQVEPTVAKLFQLANHIESAKFKEFWTEVNDSREILSVVPEFDAAIRRFIIGLLSTTYQTIATTQLSELLNLDQSKTSELIASAGWKQGQDTVTFPPSEVLQSKTKKSL